MIVDYPELGRGCAKILLLVVNGGCVLIGLCCVIFTIADLNTLAQYGDEKVIGTAVGDIIIMAASFLLIAISTFGSVGAAKANLTILYVYTRFLVIMIILEMFIAMYICVQRYGQGSTLSGWLREEFFRNVTNDDAIFHRNLWDSIQITYECCGLYGPEDYLALKKQISVSCCPRAYHVRNAYAKQELYRFCIQTTGYYKVGCEEEILQLLKTDSDWLMGIAFTCFWFEVAGIFLAMWLAKTVQNELTKHKKQAGY